MNKVAKVLVLGTNQGEVSSLLAGARELGNEVVLVALGLAVGTDGADRAIVIDTESVSVAQIAPSIVQFVTDENPDILLAETGSDGRLLAAAVASAWGECALVDAMNIHVENDRLYAERMVYGGNGIKTESSPFPAVVCVACGEYQPVSTDVCTSVEAAQINGAEGIQTISVESRTVSSVDLGSASIVVGVGRGMQDTGIGLAESFASTLGAEMACTRPIAEEAQMLPRERYVGISGQMIKPKVYIACGISGQAQHLVGVDQSDKVIAINKDKNAPIFKYCDIGIVGDVADVLPKIAASF